MRGVVEYNGLNHCRIVLFLNESISQPGHNTFQHWDPSHHLLRRLEEKRHISLLGVLVRHRPLSSLAHVFEEHLQLIGMRCSVPVS